MRPRAEKGFANLGRDKCSDDRILDGTSHEYEFCVVAVLFGRFHQYTNGALDLRGLLVMSGQIVGLDTVSSVT